MHTKQSIEDIRHFIYTENLIMRSRFVVVILLAVTIGITVLQYFSIRRKTLYFGIGDKKELRVLF